MSIRLRLTLWYSGFLIVVLLASGSIVYGVVYKNTMDDIRGQLRTVAGQTGVVRTPQDLKTIDPLGLETNNIFIQLVSFTQSREGTISDKSNNMRARVGMEGFSFPHPGYADVKERFVAEKVQDVPFLIYEVPVPNNAGSLVGVLQVGALTVREELLFSKLRTILWISGLVGALAAFCLGMFLSRKSLSPINQVTEAAQRIDSGSDLSMRIPRGGTNDEIGRLTDTLNGMLARLEVTYNHLEESNAAQRRFVSDASHELRTPLTTIRGNVDLLEKIWTIDEAADSGERFPGAHLPAEQRKEMSLEAIRDIADEARRMSRLVNDLLALARADAGYAVEMEPLQLRPLAEEAARRASFLPRRAEWIVGPLEALDEVWVAGNRDYLLQLLFILIENGFKYTPGGHVRMYATASGDRIGLSITDTGIGLSEEQLPHIFERFYRADQSRGETSGTGLGLSIAKWIADLHKAKLEVKSRPGVGTAFTLWLPLLESDGRDFSGRGKYDIMGPTESPAIPDPVVAISRESEEA